MGSAAEIPIFTNHGSTIKEHEQEGEDMDHYEEEPDSASGCGCFRLFGFESWRRNDCDRRHLLQEGEKCREMTWLMKKLDEFKKVSEVLAGPKWKNFIRKIGGYCNGKKQRTRFQYDPHSYALNFDGGREEDELLLGFQSRFAAPPVGENRQTGS